MTTTATTIVVLNGVYVSSSTGRWSTPCGNATHEASTCYRSWAFLFLCVGFVTMFVAIMSWNGYVAEFTVDGYVGQTSGSAFDYFC